MLVRALIWSCTHCCAGRALPLSCMQVFLRACVAACVHRCAVRARCWCVHCSALVCSACRLRAVWRLRALVCCCPRCWTLVKTELLQHRCARACTTVLLRAGAAVLCMHCFACVCTVMLACTADYVFAGSLFFTCTVELVCALLCFSLLFVACTARLLCELAVLTCTAVILCALRYCTCTVVCVHCCLLRATLCMAALWWCVHYCALHCGGRACNAVSYHGVTRQCFCVQRCVASM